LSTLRYISFALALAVSSPALATEPDFQQKAAAAFASAIEEFRVPGLVVGVTQNGRHSFYSHGLASKADQRAVDPDTLFELGSISKTFTVTLAAMAEQQGRLSLDDKVAEHLCAGACTIGDDLTLMDLATHHSGGLPLQVPDSVKDAAAMGEWLRDWKPAQPGARSYSNISIGLLGHLTAGALGTTYENALKTSLLSPLGLSNTWISVPQQAMATYSYGYDRKTDAPIRVNPGVFDAEAYGVKSSARDMLKFLDAQLGNGDVPADVKAAIARTQEGRFRTEYFVQDMIWEQYEWPADLQTLVAGNGTDFILNPQPMKSIDPALPPQQNVILNKTGSTNGFGGYIALLPGQDMGIVVLANRNFPNEARIKATYALIEALRARQ
jgi:beta-lactamase class C